MKNFMNFIAPIAIILLGAVAYFGIQNHFQKIFSEKESELSKIQQDQKTVRSRLEKLETKAAFQKTMQQAPKQEQAVDETPFISNVHDLVDRAAAIYEKFEQTPEAMIRELALLTKSDWINLANQNFDLSTPEGVKRALTQTRQKAKFKLLQRVSVAVTVGNYK